MSNLRSQFKATSVVSLKKKKEEDDKLVGVKTNNTDFIEITGDGKSNKIRLAPKFQEEESFYHLRVVTWVKIEKKDGTDMIRVPVLNAGVHGNGAIDIIESYIKFVISRLNANKEDDKKKIDLINDWKNGLKKTTSHWAYGWKIVKDEAPKFGILDMNYTVREGINTLAIIEDDDEAIDIDPFTDPDSGIPILITYNKDEKDNKKKYKIQLSKSAYALTDEMLEELASKKPLTSVLKGVYGLKDFEIGLEGIRNFDYENEIELFDEDDFQEEILKIRSQFVRDEEEQAPKKSSKKVVEEDDEDEEEEEAPKKQTPKKQVPVQAAVEDDEDEEESEEEEEKTKAPKELSAKEKLAMLKEKMRK